MKKVQPESHKCEGKVWDRYSYYHSCPNKAKYERNGMWYCGIHDPVKRKEKEEIRKLRYEKEQRISGEKYRRSNAERNYCRNLTTDYLEAHAGEISNK